MSVWQHVAWLNLVRDVTVLTAIADGNAAEQPLLLAAFDALLYRGGPLAKADLISPEEPCVPSSSLGGATTWTPHLAWGFYVAFAVMTACLHAVNCAILKMPATASLPEGAAYHPQGASGGRREYRNVRKIVPTV